jgi:hypothetical protein
MSGRLPELEEARARADERLRVGAELAELQRRVRVALDVTEMLLTFSRDARERAVAAAVRRALEGEGKA